MNPDGSNPTNLSNNPGNDFDPAWSPDGTKIAFTRFNSDGTRKIYVMNADGSNQTDLSTTGHSDAAAWSPDGTRIAFSSDRDTNGIAEIYTMNPDGSNPTNISNSSEGEFFPDWQPLPTNNAPTVTKVNPDPGSTTTDRTPTIAATVSAQQTDLAKANITLTLDGQTIPRAAFSYNRTTDRLTYTPGKKLTLGIHNVRVVAKDEANLSTTKNWGFEIVHP
jgi:dipeptidyl aminopeptidase/acylaminoacyl peptidase